MIKIKRNYAIFLLLIIALLVLSSCTSSKQQCKTTSDCAPRKCFVTRCEDKKCVYNVQQNCCGNKLMEGTEDGKIGNKCTCPLDYGTCEGKAKIKRGSRTEDAVYAHYYCNEASECVVGAESKDVIPQTFLDTINVPFFKASSVISYNKPFDTNNNAFEVRVTLDDIDENLVLPVKLTNIRVLLSSESAKTEQLIAEQQLDSIFENVGDTITIEAPLNLGYRPLQAEEVGSIRYMLSYEYTKKVASGKANGTTLYTEETAREKFTSPSKQVFFVGG